MPFQLAFYLFHNFRYAFLHFGILDLNILRYTIRTEMQTCTKVSCDEHNDRYWLRSAALTGLMILVLGFPVGISIGSLSILAAMPTKIFVSMDLTFIIAIVRARFKRFLKIGERGRSSVHGRLLKCLSIDIEFQSQFLRSSRSNDIWTQALWVSANFDMNFVLNQTDLT